MSFAFVFEWKIGAHTWVSSTSYASCVREVFIFIERERAIRPAMPMLFWRISNDTTVLLLANASAKQIAPGCMAYVCERDVHKEKGGLLTLTFTSHPTLRHAEAKPRWIDFQLWCKKCKEPNQIPCESTVQEKGILYGCYLCNKNSIIILSIATTPSNRALHLLHRCRCHCWDARKRVNNMLIKILAVLFFAQWRLEAVTQFCLPSKVQMSQCFVFCLVNVKGMWL